MPIEKVLVDIFGNIKLGAVWMTRGCPRKAASSRKTAGGHAEQFQLSRPGPDPYG
jgi:hypothetical protein